MRALEACRMQSPVRSLGPPVLPLAQDCVSCRASRIRPESASYLTHHLMTTTPPTNPWLNLFPNSRSLKVGCLWVGSTEAPTNGRARPVA